MNAPAVAGHSRTWGRPRAYRGKARAYRGKAAGLFSREPAARVSRCERPGSGRVDTAAPGPAARRARPGTAAGPVTTSRYTGRINGFYRLENRRDTARAATAEMVDALRAGLA